MDPVERIANTVLYEGYRLFPYSPTSIKNTRPSLFGVVYPEEYNKQDQGAIAHMQTECIVRGSGASKLDVTLRFLHLKEMNFSLSDLKDGKKSDQALSVNGYLERKVGTGSLSLDELADERNFAIEFEQESNVETLRDTVEKPIATCISRLSTLKGSMSILTRRVEGTKDLFKIRVRIANTTPMERDDGVDRDSVLRQSFLSTHLILRAIGGAFMSLTETDGDAKDAIKGCSNVNMWPVLASRENDAMLSSPIILYDHPEIAPESTGDFFDSTEIEEYLLLHIAMLSDEEKERFSQGDEKLRAAFEKAKKIGPDEMLKLHGTFRFTKSADTHGKNATKQERLTIDSFDAISKGGPVTEYRAGDVTLRKGQKIRLKLSGRKDRSTQRTDSFDDFLDNKVATIEKIFIDYGDKPYVAVTIDDDPAQDLAREMGRFLFFFPEELEVLQG